METPQFQNLIALRPTKRGMLLKMFETKCETVPPEKAMEQLRAERPHLRNSIDVGIDEQRGWDALPFVEGEPTEGQEFDYGWTAEDMQTALEWRESSLAILFNPGMVARMQGVIGKLNAPLEFHLNLALETHLTNLEDWQARQAAKLEAEDEGG